MKRISFGIALFAGVLLAAGACGDDDPTGLVTYQLTFNGDASFQGPHGGQNVYVAIVRDSDDFILAEQSGVVSATADPSFSFTFPNTLPAGVAYDVDYFIDSNFGGGTVGACDPPATDHQWSESQLPATGDVTITESHNANFGDVCANFN